MSTSLAEKQWKKFIRSLMFFLVIGFSIMTYMYVTGDIEDSNTYLKYLLYFLLFSTFMYLMSKIFRKFIIRKLKI